MDQVFPLPAPQPNPDVVRMHQAVNNQALLSVAEAMQQAVRDRQHANGIDVATTAGKMAKTVRGLQSNNTKLLRPVVQGLQGTVAASQAANAAALSTLPPSVASLALSAPPPSAVVPGAPGTWAVLSRGSECIALPAGQDLGQYAGWTPTITNQSQAEAQSFASQCVAPAPANAILKWYCLYDTNGTPFIQQLDSSAVTNGTIVLPSGLMLTRGPYDTQEQAAADCPGPVVTLPPPPPPEPPPPPPPPPLPPPEPPPQPPPEPPPIKDISDLITILSNDVSCTGGDFCTRMANVRKLFVQLGNALSNSSNDAMNWEFWEQIVSVWKEDNDYIVNFKASVRALLKRVTASHLPRLYQNSLRYCLGDKMYDVIALTALRHACEWLDGIATGVSSNGTDGQSQDTSVHGNVVIVSGSQGGTTGASHSFTESGSIKLVLVPIIQLIDFLIRWTVPTEPLSVPDATGAYLTGFIDEGHFRCYVEMAGLDYDAYLPVASANAWHPTPFDTERLWRIGWLTDDEREKYQRWNRMGDSLSLQTFSQAYEQYPPITDLIRFMVRDVWDPSVVEFGQLDTYFNAKWTAESAHLGRIAGISDDIAKLYWRAHWVYPSAGQAFEMLHRLRDGRVDPAIVFTAADTAKLLGINDMAPGFVDRMVAISYRTLDLRAIRSAFDTGQLSKLDVVERLQDIGFSQADASLKADSENYLRLRRIASQAKGWTPASLAKSFAAGSIPDVTVRVQMAKLGYSPDTAKELMDVATLGRFQGFALQGERRAMIRAQMATLTAYQSGAIPRDQALSVFLTQGYSARAAAALLDAQDLLSRNRLLEQAIRAVRTAALQGSISIPQASAQLTAIGVSAHRIDEYLATWQLLLTPKKRLLGRTQVLKLVSEGILDTAQAAERLHNLGFPADDTQLMLLEVAYKRQQGELRANTALDKQRQKAAAALLRESERLKTLGDKIRVSLCRKTPPATLRRWYVSEIIDSQYVVDSLTCQGYTPDQIGRSLEEFNQTKSAKAAKAAAKSAKASAGTNAAGTGASTAGPTTG